MRAPCKNISWPLAKPGTASLALMMASGLMLAGVAWAEDLRSVDPEIPPGPQVNSADAHEDAYPKSLGLAVLPGARHVPMDGQLSTGGVPLDALVFFTEQTVGDVMEFYSKDIKARGLRLAEHRFSPSSGYVGFYHSQTQTMRLATVQAKPGGGSMIILSAMNPAPLVGKQMQVPEDLPSLPNAVNVVTTSAEQGGTSNQTVYFEALGAPEQVLKRIEQSGHSKGWNPARTDQKASQDGLTLKRDGRTCIIRATLASNSTDANPSSAITMVVIEDAGRQARKHK